jgi:DNA polymerase III epsilon subunit-like protein
MIVLDFETTGLIAPSVADLEVQPRIIEIGALKLNDRFEEIGRIDELVDPGIPITDEITRITGIKNEDLKGKRKIQTLLPEMAEFFLGEETLIAHNLDFDLSVLYFELQRHGWERRFPFPPNHICTVDASYHIKGRRLKLVELFEITQGKKLNQTHRAIEDVEALALCFKSLKTC